MIYANAQCTRFCVGFLMFCRSKSSYNTRAVHLEYLSQLNTDQLVVHYDFYAQDLPLGFEF